MKSRKSKTVLLQKFKKYIAAFNYYEKTLTVLSAKSGGISLISFASIIGAPAGIASASFSLILFLTTEIIKKLLKITRNKKKKYNKIVMLARSKLNSIKTLISLALIYIEINHEEYKTVINEEENYRRLKENIIMVKGRDELNEKEDKRIKTNKIIRENNGNA